MRALVLMLALTLAATAQQGGDIYTRLRHAELAEPSREAAVTALARKDFASVENLLQEARPTTQADQAEIFCLLGAVRFLADEMDGSVQGFQQAEQLRPLGDGDSFTLAMAEVKLGRDAEAAARLGKLAAQFPQRPLYLYWLGKIDYDERRYDEAVVKLRRVVALEPESVRGFNSLGLALDMQGHFDAAREALEKAAELNRKQKTPSAWPAHDLGFLLLRMEKFTEAEAALREALRYDRQFALAHYHLGRVLEKENLLPGAVDEYRSAISLDAKTADACYSLALLYRKMHDEPEAEKMFAEYKKRKN